MYMFLIQIICCGFHLPYCEIFIKSGTFTTSIPALFSLFSCNSVTAIFAPSENYKKRSERWDRGWYVYLLITLLGRYLKIF